MLTKTPGDFEARSVASNEKRRVQGLTRSGGGVQFLLALPLNNYFQLSPSPPPPHRAKRCAQTSSILSNVMVIWRNEWPWGGGLVLMGHQMYTLLYIMYGNILLLWL